VNAHDSDYVSLTTCSTSIVDMQGVDPSIRAEVWEFLLGCYALSSTSEDRRKLRTARRFALFLFIVTGIILFSRLSERDLPCMLSGFKTMHC
jgi:hypothetical protein